MGLPNDFRSSDPYLTSLMNDLIQSFMSLRFYIVGKRMLILEGNTWLELGKTVENYLQFLRNFSMNFKLLTRQQCGRLI